MTSRIAAAFTTAPAALQLALMLGALAGLRIGEIATLDSSNVHLDADPPILNGGHLKPNSIRCQPNRMLERAGVPKWTFHQLRHFFGSEAARWSGGNVVLVAALMGHQDTNTTMGYIGWSPTEGAEVVAKITGAGVADELAARRRAAVMATIVPMTRTKAVVACLDVRSAE